MIVLITGGSGSGKSAYAEEVALTLAQKNNSKKLFYLATMQIYGDEGRKKVERHHRLRAGKGFSTIECQANVAVVFGQNGVTGRNSNATALLECMSNLTANEMFAAEGKKDAAQVTEKVLKDIRELEKQLSNLVIVTNNVFEDGIVYDADTTDYCLALGRVNQGLAKMADIVTEVVAGISVAVKGEKL